MNLSALPVRQRCVLVVDDEPQNVKLIAKRLQAGGLQVLTAGSGQEALERAQALQPDLVLLDLHMPDMDGFAVLTRMQASADTAQIPVIFVSAEEDAALRVTALGMGGHDFIVKPFHPEELLARVQVALRTKAAQEHLRLQQRELDQMTRKDPLTGLYNRRHLDEVLERELRCSRECGRPLSIALVDLDHFKTVNDSFGHPAGDQVLYEIGAIITSRIRHGDTVGRYGGEEFLLILPSTPARGAWLVVDQIRRIAAAHQFRGCPGHPVTFSAGVAATDSDAADVPGLVAAADRWLYAAKRAGRNRVLPATNASSRGDGEHGE